jgi:hypothetical protein
VQVRGEGDVGVGSGIDGVIIIVVLGDCNPLGSCELLYQVMDNGLLILTSEGQGRRHARAPVAHLGSCV